MTVRQLGQDDDSGGFAPGELARTLARIETYLSGLETRLVVKAVYDAEQREAHNTVTQIQLRAAEDRDHLNKALGQERLATERWQSGAISWIRWLAALAVTAFLGVASLAISILTK